MVYDADGVPHAARGDAAGRAARGRGTTSPSFDPTTPTRAVPAAAKATDWVNVELDLGDGPKMYRRDTNVMPNWAGSSWYQLRYIDPNNDDALCDIENERYWTGPRPETHGPDDPGGVDLYVGGVEHAVLHLLYSRFWHKVLFDLGHVTSLEPYRRLFNQATSRPRLHRLACVEAADVVERDGSSTGQLARRPLVFRVRQDGQVAQNAVSPDEICDTYGAAPCACRDVHGL